MKQSVILMEKVGRKVSDGTLHHGTPFICMPMLKVADTSKFGPHIKFEIFTLGTSFIHS